SRARARLLLGCFTEKAANRHCRSTTWQALDVEDVAAAPHDQDAPAPLGIGARRAEALARKGFGGQSDAAVPHGGDDAVLAGTALDLDRLGGVRMLNRVGHGLAHGRHEL